jgi:hypothetical protein
MKASKSMNQGKSMDASNRRTNNRINPCISMGPNNIEMLGKGQWRMGTESSWQRWALPIEFRYSGIPIAIELSNSYRNI